MLASDKAAYVYLETGVHVENGSAAHVSGSTLKLSGLTFPDGVVNVSFYHPSSGRKSTDIAIVSDGSLSLSLSSFTHDLAIILRATGSKDESDNDPDDGGDVNPQPSITSPVPGTQLSGSTVTWRWSSNETRASDWWLFIGTSEGKSDVYDSGNLHHATSQTFSNLPINGEQLYITLWHRDHRRAWQTIKTTYRAVERRTDGRDGQPILTSPVPGSRISDSTVTWDWSTNGVNATDWWLFIGRRKGGRDIYDSRNLHHATSHKVIGLPINGAPFYLTLWYRHSDGSWRTISAIYETVK